MWYVSWPYQGVPNEPSAVIALLIEARSYIKGKEHEAPIVVHCSPGTGRTGAIICIDMCIRDFEVNRTVDIPKCVYNIRKDRAGSVQTKDQYAFIYQVSKSSKQKMYSLYI
jgi:protein tyrosine phosphatase